LGKYHQPFCVQIDILQTALALRTAAHTNRYASMGWIYQMQSPQFVISAIVIRPAKMAFNHSDINGIHLKLDTDFS